MKKIFTSVSILRNPFCIHNKEIVAKAMQYKDAEELMALARAEGMELTKEEARAYLDDLKDVELDEEITKQVAGGIQKHHWT